MRLDCNISNFVSGLNGELGLILERMRLYLLKLLLSMINLRVPMSH